MRPLRILGFWSLGESGLLLCWGYIAWVTGGEVGLGEFMGAGIGLLIGVACLAVEGTIEIPFVRKIVGGLVHRVAPDDRAVRKLARAGIWAGAVGMLTVILTYLTARIAGTPYREMISPVYVPSIIALGILLASSLAVSFLTRPIEKGDTPRE